MAINLSSELRKANLFFMLLIIFRIVGSIALQILLYGKEVPIEIDALLSQLIFIFFPVVIFMIATKKSFKDFSLFKNLKAVNFILVILISLLLLPSISFFAGISSILFPNQIAGYVNSLNVNFFAAMLLIGIIPAFCEELALRGVIFHGHMKGGTGAVAAIVMNGILFAVLHMDMQQFLYAMYAGIIFSYVVKITGSLMYSIVMHLIINGINLAALYFGPDSSAQQATEAITASEIYLVLFWAIMTVPCLLLLFNILKKKNSAAQLEEESTVNFEYNDSAEATIINFKNEKIIDVYIIISIAIFVILQLYEIFTPI